MEVWSAPINWQGTTCRAVAADFLEADLETSLIGRLPLSRGRSTRKPPRRRLQIDSFTRRLPVAAQIQLVANGKRNPLALSRRHIRLQQGRLQASTTFLGKLRQRSDLNPHCRRGSRLRLEKLRQRATQVPLGSTFGRIERREQMRLQVRSSQIAAAQQDSAAKRHGESDCASLHRR